MQVQFLEEGERLIARPQGRMEAADGIDLAAAVEQRLHAGTTSVTIDLAELEFVDLGGVRAILRLARSLKGGQRELGFRAWRRSRAPCFGAGRAARFLPVYTRVTSKQGAP